MREATDTNADDTGLATPPPGKSSLIYSQINTDILHQEALHELRRNPPVMIQDWPDHDGSSSGMSDTADEPIDSIDWDPEYIERSGSPGLDPLDEPELPDEVIRRLFEINLCDLTDEEWIDLCKYSSSCVLFY